MAGLRIEGNTSGHVAEVDAQEQMQVVLNDNPLYAGHVRLTAEADPGTYTGTPSLYQIDADEDFRIRAGLDSVVFQETWAGSALNSAQWSSTVTTMTTAVSGNFLKLNSGSNAGTSTVARVQSYNTFSMGHASPTYIEFPLQVNASGVGINNTTWEVGWNISSGTTAPTDGVFIRMSSAGVLTLVESIGGSETPSASLTYSSILPVNTTVNALIVIDTKQVELWINNVLIVKLARPSASAHVATSMALPFTARIYNAGVAPASATQLWIGPVTISRGGYVNLAKPEDAAALCGFGGYQGQSGGTMGQTANWANSAEPVAATLSNTAAGYTTLGGQWSFAAPAGAVTDFCLFGYQVPAAAAGSFNKPLLIRGIHISSMNSGAAVATTATILQWGLAVGSTAVSLATSEAATTKAPRRIALGVQGFVVGAAIGATANDIDIKFAAPLLAEPGSFIQVIVRVPVGTATASQVIRGTCLIVAQFLP